MTHFADGKRADEDADDLLVELHAPRRSLGRSRAAHAQDVMLYPESQLRAAPPIKSPTLGQLTGLAWLAWMLDRSGRG